MEGGRDGGRELREGTREGGRERGTLKFELHRGMQCTRKGCRYLQCQQLTCRDANFLATSSEAFHDLSPLEVRQDISH